MAYLRQQYRVVAIVFLLLALVLCASWPTASGCRIRWVPFAFLTGGLFLRVWPGYIGMRTATYRFGPYRPCRQANP